MSKELLSYVHSVREIRFFQPNFPIRTASVLGRRRRHSHGHGHGHGQDARTHSTDGQLLQQFAVPHTPLTYHHSATTHHHNGTWPLEVSTFKRIPTRVSAAGVLHQPAFGLLPLILQIRKPHYLTIPLTTVWALGAADRQTVVAEFAAPVVLCLKLGPLAGCSFL